MSSDLYRAVIGADSIIENLLRALYDLPEVQDATARWEHGHWNVRVVLDPWTWDAMAQPSIAIELFAREHVRSFGVTTEFVPTELHPPGGRE